MELNFVQCDKCMKWKHVNDFVVVKPAGRGEMTVCWGCFTIMSPDDEDENLHSMKISDEK